MSDTTNIKIKYELLNNYVALNYDGKVSRHFWRIAIVTGVLPSRDSEIKGVLWRLMQFLNVSFILKMYENTYHDTHKTDKARQQMLRLEAAVIDELKTKYECQLYEHWEQRVVFKYYKY